MGAVSPVLRSDPDRNRPGHVHLWPGARVRSARNPGRTAMQVPLTTLDFLERAETVFADRIAVVDEPDPPGGGLGSFTYAELGRRARSIAVAFDELTADIPVAHRFVLGTGTDAALFERPGTPRFLATDENATATINYTSGTTARPKGVQMTHRNLWLNAVTFGWHMGVTDRDVYLHTLPTFHCNGWGLPFAVGGMGARQVVIRKIDGEDILERVEREGITFLAGAPAVVAATLDAAVARTERGAPEPRRDTVRIVVAGAPPPSKIIERVEAELGWEFMQIYGLTETSPCSR